MSSPVSPVAPVATASTRRRLRGLRSVATAFFALLGVIASLFVSVGPASAITVPARTALENSIVWAVKDLIVSERAAHGVPYIGMSVNLQLSARRHNIAMARANTMSHQLPGEPSFGTRITQTGYIWDYAGENIAWNSVMSTSGALTLEKMMYNEVAPYNGHLLNILNRHFSNVGVDVYLDWAHHKLWLTTDFGHRR